MTAWKNFERRVAQLLRGKRIPRGADYSASLPDVIAKSEVIPSNKDGLIFAECKYSQNAPIVGKILSDLKDKRYVILKDQSNGELFIFTSLKNIHRLGDPTKIDIKPTEEVKKLPRYIYKHLEQCIGYTNFKTNKKFNPLMINLILGIDSYKNILPIVCMAEANKKDSICYTNLSCLFTFHL